MIHPGKNQLLIAGLLCDYSPSTRVLSEHGNPKNAIKLLKGMVKNKQFVIHLKGKRFTLSYGSGDPLYTVRIPTSVVGASSIERDPVNIEFINYKSLKKGHGFIIPTPKIYDLLNGKKQEYWFGADPYHFDLPTRSFHSSDSQEKILPIGNFCIVDYDKGKQGYAGFYHEENKTVNGKLSEKALTSLARKEVESKIQYLRFPRMIEMLDPLGAAKLYQNPPGFWLCKHPPIFNHDIFHKSLTDAPGLASKFWELVSGVIPEGTLQDSSNLSAISIRNHAPVNLSERFKNTETSTYPLVFIFGDLFRVNHKREVIEDFQGRGLQVSSKLLGSLDDNFLIGFYDTQQRIFVESSLKDVHIKSFLLPKRLLQDVKMLPYKIEELNQLSQSHHAHTEICSIELTDRLNGKKPEIDIGGNPYVVYWNEEKLVHKHDPNNVIQLKHCKVLPDNAGYQFNYNLRINKPVSWHAAVHLQEQKNDIVSIIIPCKERLDPVAAAISNQHDLLEYLKTWPYHARLTGEVMPLAETVLTVRPLRNKFKLSVKDVSPKQRMRFS